MDNINISKMTVSDLELIKDFLISDFDDFWNYNVFKSELLNPSSEYIVARLNDNIARLWRYLEICR